MDRASRPALAAILLTVVVSVSTACAPSATQILSLDQSEAPAACPAITTATSVMIILPPGSAPYGKGAYRLKDREAIGRLSTFVNLHRNVEPPSADTPPYPSLKATFYEGYHTVAIFGSNPGFFYLQCSKDSKTVRGARPASAGEQAEFEMLITRPEQAASQPAQ
jgi:hypothetical protein